MFEIEKGVKLPARKHHKTAVDYPFKQMKVGDSFAVPGPRKNLERVMSAYYRYQKAINNPAFKITTRMNPDRSGYRVWRIQ